MPMYQFENENGEQTEMHYSMSEVPVIGEIVTDGTGAEWRRVSSFLVDAGMDAVVHGYPYVSRSAPRYAKGAECNKKGMPIITSRRHERDFASRHGLTRE